MIRVYAFELEKIIKSLLGDEYKGDFLVVNRKKDNVVLEIRKKDFIVLKMPLKRTVANQFFVDHFEEPTDMVTMPVGTHKSMMATIKRLAMYKEKKWELDFIFLFMFLSMLNVMKN